MPTLDAPTRPRPTRAPRAPRAEEAYATRGGAALAAAPARRPAPRPVPEERGRHLRVVAPAERVRRRLTPALGVLLTAGLFALLFAVAIAHTLLVQGQIRLDAIDADLATEQARYQELRNEVAAMESPARIVGAAQELGMVIPEDLVYLQPEAEPLVTSTPDTGGTSSTGAPVDTMASAAAAEVAADAWREMKPLLRGATP